MKTAMKWCAVAAFAATGIVMFACGGDTPPANTGGTGSASGSVSSQPPVGAQSTPAASSAPVASTAPTPTPPPPLVIVAMKLSGGGLKGTIELKDDGSIVAGGKTGGKITGAEMQDATGKTLLSVAADGTVKLEGTKVLKFNDKDELVVDDGAKMIVGDDGVVKMLNPDGKADKDSGKVKFTGFKPTARRTAIILVLGLLMPSKAASSTPVSASAAPSASHAPANKK